ncbi:hypothetical protein DFH11DRAFT_518266 [Phellopilus nigrolimitatus]|nr:hypothetical protein DFH11DRAFT_518266 [Phellopilus nigrolimitatus]
MVKGFLTVHNFASTDSKFGRSSPFSSEELLAQGRDLVANALATKGWIPVVLPETPVFGSKLNAGRSLVLSTSPPLASSLRYGHGKKKLKKVVNQWGDLDDTKGKAIDKKKLREFRGTDFSYLLTRKKPLNQPQQIHDRKRSLDEEQGVDLQREKKRRRIESASLYDLIPQPHHHPHPAVAPGQSLDTDIMKRFLPYSKAPFFASTRYSTEEVGLYFKDPFARSAWIVPVRGKLPWIDASHARLLDTLGSASEANRQSINWTPFLLRNFWQDLLEIRNRRVLGAFSFSFHVGAAEKEGQISKHTFFDRTDSRRTKVPPLADPPTPVNLAQCTYIKIYHDVRYALYVRSVLDAWRTEIELEDEPSTPPDAPGTSRMHMAAVPTVRKLKARPLLGAKLVLVDEASQPVGTC